MYTLKSSYLFFSIFLIAFNISSSQEKEDNRLIVGVAPFITKDPRVEKFAPMLQEEVLNALNRQKKFLLVDIDVKSSETRKEALEDQDARSENWKFPKNITPDYVLIGSLSGIKFIRLSSGKGYKATINYIIKIENTETGELINNGTATFSSSESDIKITPESAFQSAAKTTIPDLNTYLIKSFPIEVKLGKPEKTKGNKILEVILKGGSKYGIKEKMIFEIYYLDDSLGAPLPKFFGQIQIVKVLNENYSLAKVIKGQKELFEHLKSNKSIICKSL